MLLQVHTQIDGPRAVVRASGEIDMSTADSLKSEVHAALGRDCTDVTVDLRRVSFIDSVGLGVLVNCHKQLQQSGGAFRIVATNANVLRMFEITGLDNVFTITHSGPLENPVV
ncbi:MAG: STAS domain-containing protein [Nocardioidaceae bacterium]